MWGRFVAASSAKCLTGRTEMSEKIMTSQTSRSPLPYLPCGLHPAVYRRITKILTQACRITFDFSSGVVCTPPTTMKTLWGLACSIRSHDAVCLVPYGGEPVSSCSSSIEPIASTQHPIMSVEAACPSWANRFRTTITNKEKEDTSIEPRASET